MARETSLADRAVWAQKTVEGFDVDDKYKPALFYFLLAKGEQRPADSITRPSSRPRAREARETRRVSAPAELHSLFETGFFKEGKTIDQVTKRLADSGFHFGYETTNKALQRAKFLRGEGGKRDRKYYQRYPPP